MNIWTQVSGKRSVAVDPVAPTVIGCRMASTGSALVSVTYDVSKGSRHPIRRCAGIERLPYDVGKVADRLEAIELGSKDVIVIDCEGAGGALWIALGSPRGRRHYRLYEATGRARQTLVDPIPAMIRDGTFTFAAGLADQEAMTKALIGYRREVLDDGVIGNELAVALFLALGHRPATTPRIY
jgi:hypothetical protein